MRKLSTASARSGLWRHQAGTASIHLGRHCTLQPPHPEAPPLAFFVREAWPSPATGPTITDGILNPDETLTLTSGAILFGDGSSMTASDDPGRYTNPVASCRRQ